MVDAIIAAPVHVLVSTRFKTEWVVERDEKTRRNVPRKVGLQPVMRDGIEYEFAVCGEMDQNNNLTITKSRCPALTGRVFEKPGKELTAALKGWLATPIDAAISDSKQVSTAMPPFHNGNDAQCDSARLAPAVSKGELPVPVDRDVEADVQTATGD
jgi:hypothetical protein